MRYFSLILPLALFSISAVAQKPQGMPSAVPGAGVRQYDVIVNQTNDTVVLNSRLRGLNRNRGILTDLATGYLSLGTSTLLSASKSVLDLGIGMVKEAVRDKRPDWQEAVRQESTFIKFLPMQTQILDFYGKPSNNGALDPMDMKFNGFGCRQTITVNDTDGKPEEKEVFYLSCRLRDDEAGLARMLNHAKFEVVVDELRFNPYLCNLPNDSVNANPATRVDFSFVNRKNLTFKVDVKVSSSWINQAIQVHDNVTLGNFTITALIDPEKLNADGVFTYKADNPEDKSKMVSMTGDSFIVPRSYIGTDDLESASDTWGTGQYRVDMLISESCQINEDYYTENKNGKKSWRKERWNPEWQIIRKRTPRQNVWQQVSNTITKDFKGNQWITTLTEPLTTNLISHEGLLLNKAKGMVLPAKSSASPAPAASSAGAPTGASSGAGAGMPAGKPK